jgi:histidinol-phosphate aminotransferase
MLEPDALNPRAAVRGMAPYSPPSGGREGKLRLDFNENTVGCSPRVVEALQQYLTADHLSIYPEYAAALQELAAFFNAHPDEFTLTNGTDEAIQLLVNTFAGDSGEVLTLRPSYAMYKFYAQLAGASVREIEYPADLQFPLEEFLAAIGPSTKAVLISNPNNPTGGAIDLNAIRSILEAAPRAAVLIDEAYFEFFGVTALPWIRKRQNLFVSRTFSKVYGMAAMRCGGLFSSAENMQWIRKAQSPYSVNSLAVIAARAAVRDTEYVKQYVAEVLQSREDVCRGLDELGIRYFPSHANFVLMYLGERAIPIRDALRDRGVLVRDRSYEIPGCVRVTLGTRAGTERFLAELWRLWTQA